MDVVNVNVEDDIDLFPGKVFDLILILDTLEHLLTPWNFLKKIKSKLSDNGSIVISIPNIRHYSIIINLFIKGEWEYEESGILDNTHLRFFTKKSLFKIFEKK